MRRLPVLAAALLLSGCTAAPTGLTVLGASSTRVIDEAVAARSASEVTFSHAGSSTLVQQLIDGAPADLLITADHATMSRAVEGGVVEGPRVVAHNELVMVVGRGASISSVDDLGPDTALVLCDPQVPCGAVTAQLIDPDIRPVSLEHSVADVLGKVVSGQADAGWVYRTDALAAGDAVTVVDIPGAVDHPTAVVAAVTTGSADREEAQALLDLLSSPTMRPVWAEHGFTPAR